jgi:hypothetical protein
MLNNILRNFGLGRRRAPLGGLGYRRAGGGALLPMLGYLAYRYRAPIGRFFRERFGRLENRGRAGMDQGFTTP